MLNFRKISAVLVSTVMLGSSLGIAAAANYPAPFVSGGVADVAIVYGTGSGVSSLDVLYSGNIQNDLQAKIGTGIGATRTTCAGGDCYLFELASTKLNMYDNLTDVKSSKVDHSDLPNVLASLDYKSGDSKTYGYNQEITLNANLRYNPFLDSDFNDDKPAIGLKILDGTKVFNYTISWKKAPESDVTTAGRLDDFENSEINLLGRTYTILNAYNGSVNSNAVKLELMGGAVISSINRDEVDTQTLNGKSYAIRASYISDTKCTLCASIDGATETCKSELNKGETYELSDGTQVGIRSINYAAKSGTVDSVDYSLGAEKLTLQNSTTVEINDIDVSGLDVTLEGVQTGTKIKLSDIVFTWTADDDLFIANNETVTMYGIGGIKLASGGFYTPSKEITEIGNDGSRVIELVVPLKTGTAKIPILFGNGTSFTHIGKANDKLLVTGNLSSNGDATPSIVFNTSTKSVTNNDRAIEGNNKYFVASWNSSKDAESYFLTLTSFTQDSGINYTSVKDEATGSIICDKVQSGKNCIVGNLVMAISGVTKDDKSAVITLNAGGSFDTVFTKDGLAIYLPILDGFNNNISSGRGTNGNITNDIIMREEDKNGVLGGGNAFNFTAGWSSDNVRVTNARARWASDSSNTVDPDLETEEDSDVYVDWILSDLATKVVHHRPTGTGSQYTAEVEYYGDETYGAIYLAAPNADISQTSTTTSTISQLGNVVVKDNEVSSVASKNLIIVGGSCINSAAAKVLGSTSPICGAAFTEKTGIGSGQFVIQSIADIYATGKVALLVAGYNVDDTQNAATYLTTNTVDTTAGKKYKGTSSTTAELVVA